MKNYNYSFVPSFRNTRNGFAHDCLLYVEIAGKNYKFSATCFYYNRTWETYQYQTVKKNVVYNAIQFFTDDLKNKAREKTGRTFRAKETKNIFNVLCKNSQELSVLNNIYKIL